MCSIGSKNSLLTNSVTALSHSKFSAPAVCLRRLQLGFFVCYCCFVACLRITVKTTLKLDDIDIRVLTTFFVTISNDFVFNTALPSGTPALFRQQLVRANVFEPVEYQFDPRPPWFAQTAVQLSVLHHGYQGIDRG
jgi:hypothetical protein